MRCVSTYNITKYGKLNAAQKSIWPHCTVLYYCNVLMINCQGTIYNLLVIIYLPPTSYYELYNLTKNYSMLWFRLHKNLHSMVQFGVRNLFDSRKNTKQSIKDLNEIDNLIYLNLLWVPFRDSIHERITSYVTFWKLCFA